MSMTIQLIELRDLWKERGTILTISIGSFKTKQDAKDSRGFKVVEFYLFSEVRKDKEGKGGIQSGENSMSQTMGKGWQVFGWFQL